MGTNVINKFRNDMKTIMENSYTKNNRIFFGVDSGEVLRVRDFDGTEYPVTILKERPKYDEFQFKAPWLAISRIEVDALDLVGGNQHYLLTATFEMAWRQAHYQIINSVKTEGVELIDYFIEEVHKGWVSGLDQFTNVIVSRAELVPGSAIPISEAIQDSTIYGFRLSIQFRVAT